MAKLNHAKIIKGFEELINTTNGKDFFVGFLKTFSFPAIKPIPQRSGPEQWPQHCDCGRGLRSG